MSKSCRFDSKKIEKAAVLAVQNSVQRCENIDEKLDVDDKNILVDGSLELYKSCVFTKSNLLGIINVQVKGKAGKLKPNRRGFVKYQLEVEDLRRYYDVFHGVLFFCVEVGDDNGAPVGKTIYFSFLLPYDINSILNEAKDGQKKISVRLKEFPEDPREINRLARAFLSDRDKQLKAKISSYGYLEKNHELPDGIESISFTAQLFPGESLAELSGFRLGTYIYGKSEKGELSVIGKMDDICAVACGREAEVSSGSFAANTTVYAGQSDKGDTIEFEGVRFVLSEASAKVDFNIEGTIRRRYRTVHFMHEFAKSGELYVDGNRIIAASVNDANEDQLCMINESLPVYKEMAEVLDLLHIHTDWDPSQLTEHDISNIDLLHKLVIEKEPLDNQKLSSPLVHVDIHGSWVFVFALENEAGEYSFVDLFSENLCFAFGVPGQDKAPSFGESAPVPPIAALDKEGFKRVVNLDVDLLEEAFDRYPIKATSQDPLNQKLLQMLTAFDEGCQQPDGVIGCALVLAQKLYEFDNDSETYLINLMQTIRRMRDLQAGERKLLEDVAIESGCMYNKAAAFALLGSSDMAFNCIKRCTENERKLLEDYPIAAFLPK